ncbi:MAG: 4a-hydroxytetrahydrobiopterin dehydratase [Chloroflexi bacterium]|nr:4a-hydroxytetrahydrobiopterin dehydratase [Chloroflexota bacterium]
MTTQLTGQVCVACRRDSPKVTPDEIAEFKPQIPEWRMFSDDGVDKLDRTFKFDDFASAMAFTNRIANLAEGEGHHPMLVTEWGRVRVVWWTHKIKGLHKNDFIMAAKTDKTYSYI